HPGVALLALADRSFVGAMHMTTTVSVVIAATGAVLIALWMPGLRRDAAVGAAGDPAPPAAAPAEPSPLVVFVKD
ncbi:MAG TPA: hypothetical protein VF834_20320, partial [Streptosporangiaceae bacterium]